MSSAHAWRRATLVFRGRSDFGVAIFAQLEFTRPTVPESDLEPAFLAYSITKTFTAALILKVSEEGQLSLDDRLARWFPRIAHADRISLRRLLNHTGGIPDYGGLRAYHEDLRSSPSAPWSFERFAAETFDKGLLFEPGQGWAYSNPGYMLLKRVAEEATAVSYRDSHFVAHRSASWIAENFRR